MVSQKQLEANRRNAKKSTGPRTPEGKARAATNALNHGILSRLEVLPHLERQQDWEEHLASIRAALQPQGYLEELLVQRVARYSWRLQRVDRYERDTAAAGISNAERELAEREHERVQPYEWGNGCETVDEAQRHVVDFRGMLSILQGLGESSDEAPVPNGGHLLLHVADMFDISVGDPEDEPSDFPERPAGVGLYEFEWTTRTLRQGLAAMAQQSKWAFERFVTHSIATIRRFLAEAEGEVRRLSCDLDQLRRSSILPRTEDAEKIRRYEAHLNRGLFQALHELQRLQAARQGGTPPPAALDITVTPDEQEN